VLILDNIENTNENKEEKKDKKVKGRKRKVILKIFLVIFLILLICGGIFAYRVHRNGGGLQGFLMTIFGHNRETVQNLDRMNVLILGSDDGDLADTILFASYDPRTQDIVMISIPRDTFVGEDKYRARPSDRINGLYDVDDPEKIKNAVENILGIEIPFYVAIEIEAFIKLVDEIGGVWFDVPIDMRYDDYSQDLHIDLRSGYQLLNGQQAEHLVRFRKNNDFTTYSYEYGSDDYGRMRTRQRVYNSYNEANLETRKYFQD